MYNLLHYHHFGVEIKISNDRIYLLKIYTICTFFFYENKNEIRDFFYTNNLHMIRLKKKTTSRYSQTHIYNFWKQEQHPSGFEQK